MGRARLGFCGAEACLHDRLFDLQAGSELGLELLFRLKFEGFGVWGLNFEGFGPPRGLWSGGALALLPGF